MDVLNVASTEIYTILALIVNFKWNACKKWTWSLKSVVIFWPQCRYTEIAQRIFKYNDTQYISLTQDKILNNLIYRTLFYVNIYGSCKLSKNSPVFWPTLYLQNRLGPTLIRNGLIWLLFPFSIRPAVPKSCSNNTLPGLNAKYKYCLGQRMCKHHVTPSRR